MNPSNQFYKNCLKAIVIIFGGISAATMVLFCLSLTGNTVGQVITAIVGLGIVLAQYVFSAKIQQDKNNDRYDIPTIVVTAVIFCASILGTWSWLESEFNTNNQVSTKTSESYLDNRTLIEMKTITAQSHLDQAKEYSEKGNYTTQAKNSTKEADKALAELQVLINKGSNLPAATTGNSSQDMANTFGQWRWLAWFALALIIDLCPVIAILELRRLALALNSDEGGTLTSDITTTIEIRADESATLKKKFIEGYQPQGGQFHSLRPPRNDERYSNIRHCVINQTVKLGKNAIQTKFSLGTKTVDKYFEWMMQEGVIQRTDGKRTYELVPEPLSNEKTNHQTMARAT